MPRKRKPTLPEGTKIPDHIAIAMDGNGRWARARGLPPTAGHEAASKSLVEVIRACRELGVHTLTLWGFSTENWKRPPMETRKIMSIVKKALKDYKSEAMEEGVRLVHLGRKDRLPIDVARNIASMEEETKDNKYYVLNLALNYGGRDEILRAVRNIVSDGVNPKDINEDLFSSYLDTADQPYPFPDLLIRTSGEQRTSGLLPWQATYAEFYFEQSHCPDVSPEHIKAAILDYSRRRRRFGGKEQQAQFKFKPEVTAQLELAWWRLSKIPEGTRFREYAMKHVKEQFGMSMDLSLEAARHLTKAVVLGRKSEWSEARGNMHEFFKLIKEEVKLAFEPSLAAKLQVQLWRDMNTEGGDEKRTIEVEEVAQRLYAEVYRMSMLQASKLAHLRVLAVDERNMAERGMGDEHWDRAEDYLEKFYRALKDRVA